MRSALLFSVTGTTRVSGLFGCGTYLSCILSRYSRTSFTSTALASTGFAPSGRCCASAGHSATSADSSTAAMIVETLRIVFVTTPRIRRAHKALGQTAPTPARLEPRRESPAESRERWRGLLRAPRPCPSLETFARESFPALRPPELRSQETPHFDTTPAAIFRRSPECDNVRSFSKSFSVVRRRTWVE